MRVVPSRCGGHVGALILCALFVAAACGEPDGSGGAEEGDEAGAAERAGGDTAPAAEPSGEGMAPGEVSGAGAADPDLLRPNSDAVTGRAPDSFRVRFETSEGEFVVQVHRDWAPHGADRFYNLVRGGFYDGNRFFRVLDGFVAQWGIHGNPRVSAAWRDATIPADSVRRSNTPGRITYAMGNRPDTRTTQVFINYGDNSRLDAMGFAPFGEVIEGMEAVERLYAGYGEGAPSGDGPSQMRIQRRGNAFLDAEFPELDRIEEATIVGESATGPEGS